ncbi:hypothetical protein UB37_12760 [Photobacterium iliopiscarium]|jgi:hypothetical protein|uniref:DUF465 domain-containing protein n=1 Tax=Photobacterium iliopiscarium TaxID=56192 RepID=A0A0D8P626_9GAMM|nr:DUF465 domain-containing protein [Photobacterium iliopiscarium]KJG12449.1 hypothetical protein UB38_15230 [Photobacterium iliopiscarium]KJG20904.1 hypothetical protein UB37_12760 [Photobacterium iliopiscarium]PST95555.1 DUF465 domain-containing protein [Photobacterium iliopiscarium]PSU00974.1 DUF465 domain-containing protein [Photobacterium iliopiscarium]PSV82783.1 DUF465 domain-containing protein [Photobacterium iliopiscarium]
MFPEYRSLISALKGHDVHFDRLFKKHNELDDKINVMTAASGFDETLIEQLKKEKLLLKDEIFAYLQQKA